MSLQYFSLPFTVHKWTMFIKVRKGSDDKFPINRSVPTTWLPLPQCNNGSVTAKNSTWKKRKNVTHVQLGSVNFFYEIKIRKTTEWMWVFTWAGLRLGPLTGTSLHYTICRSFLRGAGSLPPLYRVSRIHCPTFPHPSPTWTFHFPRGWASLTDPRAPSLILVKWSYW